jgi:predicted TIM-barrel fold metal-dependent hydrolase
MIDAHVHAYPSVGESTARTLGRTFGQAVEKLVQNRVAPAAKTVSDRVWTGIKPLLPRGPWLDIERVAATKAKTGRFHKWIEAVGSVALAPPIVLAGTVSGLLASMDRHGIERSVVIGSRGVASNDWLLGDAMRAGGDRLVPVVTLPELDPSVPLKQWLDEYERLALAGARGFKIHSNWDGIDASHPAIGAMFEVANEHGLFIILHTGCFHVVGYKSNGVDLASFAKYFEAFPRVRVCLAHMNRDRPEDAWALMKRYDQLYTDTSWQTSTAIARAIDTVGSERIMLGSDWPLLHIELQGDALERVHQAANGAHLENVVSKSAERLIGLP